MHVRLSELQRDPDSIQVRRLGPPRGGKTSISVRTGPGGHYLVTGGWLADALRIAGVQEVEVDVLEGVTPQRVVELQLAEAYQIGRTEPVSFGLAILEHRQKFEISYAQLAERTGISSSTLFQYVSVATALAPELRADASAGRLPFRIARELAALPDQRDQRDLAAPFLDGRLPMTIAEATVRDFKKLPRGLAANERLRLVLVGASQPPPAEPRSQRPAAEFDLADGDLRAVMLAVAGRVDKAQSTPIPEYERLAIARTADLLMSKLQSFAASLKGRQEKVA